MRPQKQHLQQQQEDSQQQQTLPLHTPGESRLFKQWSCSTNDCPATAESTQPEMTSRWNTTNSQWNTPSQYYGFTGEPVWAASPEGYLGHQQQQQVTSMMAGLCLENRGESVTPVAPYQRANYVGSLWSPANLTAGYVEPRDSNPYQPHGGHYQQPIQKHSNVICKFFAQGHCSRGLGCNFAHLTKDSGDTRKTSGRRMGIRSFRGRLRDSTRDSFCLEDLRGNVSLYARDQHGCRLLQRFLDYPSDPEAMTVIFNEVLEDVSNLVIDPFGNYLCQKLLDCCFEEQKMMLVKAVASDLVEISLNVHGTRVVQKMIEVVTSAECIEIISESLGDSVVKLTKDLNGNHVVQRCLHHLPSTDNQFIYNAIADNCVLVATHKHGCCVLQRCIDYATPEQRSQIIEVVVENVLELVQDAFGNYVVQYVLDIGDDEVSYVMMSRMQGHIADLAVQKFSSNVVEKCLQIAHIEMRNLFIDEIFNEDCIFRLLQDPFANYVIQKSLMVATPAKYDELIVSLRPHISALRVTSFGKRIQSKLLKKFPELGSYQQSESNAYNNSV